MKPYSNKISYRYLAMHLEGAARHLTQLGDRYSSFDRTFARRIHRISDSLKEIGQEAEQRRKRDPLPPGQGRVMLFLQAYVSTHGSSPTRSQIAKDLGYRSNNAAECVLRQLARKGYVTLLPGVTAGIRLRRQYVSPES
jgi:SOS-response transcriptional repressor LexA